MGYILARTEVNVLTHFMISSSTKSDFRIVHTTMVCFILALLLGCQTEDLVLLPLSSDNTAGTFHNNTSAKFPV